MPGEESLKRQEYYGNPRNQFWRIMQELVGIPAAAAYAERISLLQQNRIGLWDVLHACERVGSLDSAIKYPVPNDFRDLFASHPNLKLVAFNGKKASEWFEKWWVKVVITPITIQKLILPSTSPAATMTFEKKVAAWDELRIQLLLSESRQSTPNYG